MLRSIALLLLLCTTMTVSAQSTRGFSINLDLNGTSWTVDDEGLDFSESGGGIGLGLGYGFSERISIHLRADVANMDDGEYTLGHLDLGGTYLFGADKLRPFAELSLSTRGANADLGQGFIPGEGFVDFGELELYGTAITIGGGVQYFLSNQFALTGRLSLSQGEFTDVELQGRTAEIELDSRSARFNIGLRWYPNK